MRYQERYSCDVLVTHAPGARGKREQETELVAIDVAAKTIRHACNVAEAAARGEAGDPLSVTVVGVKFCGKVWQDG